jgi:FAD/FMN-containing dehydrogenase
MLYRRMGWKTYAPLMITELYIPRTRFVNFMTAARRQVLATQANLVYGTVRLIEAENETLLRWASQDYACVIFNLLVEHSPEGVARGQAQFRALIDCALAEGGSYYLTYHRWARKDQMERAYPEFPEFLRQKRRYDPDVVFASDWLRHYQNMFE